MKLIDLLTPIQHLCKTEPVTGGIYENEIESIHYHSKDVVPGGLFVAIKGLKADGHHFIKDAVSKGASVVIAEEPTETDGVPLILVSNSRKALAGVATEFYGRPTSDMVVIGITGTNGKTTITYLIESILTDAGHNTGVIGTINYRFNGKAVPNPMTTPESLDLQRILAEMKAGGVTHVVMEVSSHAIDLDRIFGCEIDTAVFTNLTQDHLDYHPSMAEYWGCKKRLFTEILPASEKRDRITAVINAADAYGKELEKDIGYKVLSFGGDRSELAAKNVDITINGITATIETPLGSFEVSAPAIGRHNLENIMNAVGAAVATGIPPESMKAGIESVTVPGRLEKIENSMGIGLFVDYAHTPDALENVLSTVRPLTSGRVICIFGCGGDRDRTKRPVMGKIAETQSDILIVTSDNPRTEDPAVIIDDILQGLRSTGISEEIYQNSKPEKVHFVEPDREKAIRLSVRIAAKGDTILIAGKGHETYQITNNGTIDFDDREEARKAIEQITA